MGLGFISLAEKSGSPDSLLPSVAKGHKGRQRGQPSLPPLSFSQPAKEEDEEEEEVSYPIAKKKEKKNL